MNSVQVSRSTMALLVLLGVTACAPTAPSPSAAPPAKSAEQAALAAPAAKPAEQPTTAPAAKAAPPPAAPQAAAKASPQPASLTLRLDFLPAMLRSHYWLAQKEIWPQQGLTVAVNPGRGGAETVQIVASGSEPVGSAEFPAVMQGIQQGLPVTIIMMDASRYAGGLIFLKDSGINSWSDLKGKTIATNTASVAWNALLLIARRNGVAENELRIVSSDPSTHISLLLEKKIDAFTGFAQAQDTWMKCSGQSGATSWAFADHGFDVYGQAVIANTNWLRSTPDDVVARVLYGIARAATETKRDPERTFNVMKEANPSATLDRSQQLAGMARVGGYVRWMRDVSSRPYLEKGYGWVDAGEMTAAQEKLVDAGYLKEKLDINRYYTAKYLEEPMVRQAGMEFHQVAWGEVPADVKQQCGVE